MKSLKSLVYTCLLPTIFFACNNDSPGGQMTDDNGLTTAMLSAMPSLSNTNWLFENYSNNPFDTQYQNSITLQFSQLNNNEISYRGKSVINEYLGKLTIDEPQGLIISNDDNLNSLIGSISDELRAIETAYFSDLERAESFEISENRLLVYLGDKEANDTEVMIFTKA